MAWSSSLLQMPHFRSKSRNGRERKIKLMATLVPPAQVQFELGYKAFVEAYAHAKSAKLKSLMAGRHFRLARQLSEHGEWLAYAEAANISRSTIHRCIEFLELAEDWVKQSNPTLTGALLARAVDEAIMHSPKPFTALLREWKLVEQIGAYDPAAYAQRKIGGPVQMEFHYEPCITYLDALCSSPVNLAQSSLQTLETKLETALQAVRKQLEQTEPPPQTTQEIHDNVPSELSQQDA